MDERKLYYIWLSNALRPGNKCIKKLFSHFGSIENIYNALREQYKEIEIGPTDIASLCNKDLTLAESHYNYCKQNNIGLLLYDDPEYPERLRIIEDPPCMFYYRGRLSRLDDYPCVAMIGTRSCSPDGYRLAYKFAYTAAASGIVVVNGLAAGIDAACIAGALDANAYAVGLLGCGIDRIYPTSNKELFHRLSASGLILTEFPPFTEPKGSNFPVRNRVISGLCLGTTVFEANADRSGAMISAEHATKQGRQLFAIPGSPDDKNYSGALELIKNGAAIVTEPSDIICEYAMMFPHRINTLHKVIVPTEQLENYVGVYFGTAKKQIHNYSETKRKISQSKQFTESKIIKDEVKSLKDSLEKADTELKSQPLQQTPPVSKDVSLLSPSELTIYELFKTHTAMSADELVANGVNIEDALSSITLLEVYGLIRAIPGGRYEITN